jgi:tetratricopeptide (TPR) repeat protein
MIYGEVSDSRNETKGYEKRRYKDRDYQVACVSRQVTISAHMRIVDTRTGEILATRRASRTASDKVCENDNKTLKSDGVLAGYCANGLAWEFTNMFNPWFVYDEFELEKIKAEEFKDEADDAAKAAEKLEVDRAYAVYKKLYDSDPYNPKFLYNMGILYEVAGSFEEAKEMYDGALMLKDEGKYKEAAERIAGRARLVPFYASLDMAIKAHDFEAAASDASLLAKKVKVKGGGGDRIEVYADANGGSEVVAKVPGGIQLEVIEDAGDWYLVKLLGDKQGYLSKDKAED